MYQTRPPDPQRLPKADQYLQTPQGPQGPRPPQGSKSLLRRLPWWVYGLVLLCLCGGLGALVQGPKTGANVTGSQANQTEIIGLSQATQQAKAAQVPRPTNTPMPLAAVTEQPTTSGVPVANLNIANILGKPRTDVETLLGKPLSIKAETTPETGLNPPFIGTALEYTVKPYTVTVYLDKAAVARGITLSAFSAWEREDYSLGNVESYLTHFGLSMPTTKPDSDERYGKQWQHTERGLWIDIGALKGGTITSLSVWQADKIATGAPNGLPAQPTSPTTVAAQPSAGYTANISVDNAAPTTPNDTVTVTGKLLQDGKLVKGATMNLTLHYASKDTSLSATTDVDGTASQTFRVGTAKSGFTVAVDAVFEVGGSTVAKATTSFTPHK